MGMAGPPFGQQYGQVGVQQMGPGGLNAQQLQNKAALPNSLQGPGSVPNLVRTPPRPRHMLRSTTSVGKPC